ncbi:MAG: GHKL domain-containing protein [Christensenellaceae bacterium]
MEVFYLLLNALFPLLLFYYLFSLVFRDHLRFSNKKTLCILIAVTIIFTLLGILLFSLLNPLQDLDFIFIIIYMTLFLATCMIVLNSSLMQIVFTYFIIKCYMDDVFLLSKIVQSYLISPWQSPEIDFIVSYAIVFFASIAFMALFMKKLVHPLINSNSHSSLWNYLWSIPVLYYAIYKLGISANYQTPAASLPHSPEVLLPIVWIVGTFLSFFVILRMLLEITKYADIRENLRLSNLRLSLQKEQYESLQQNIEAEQQAMHDRRHLLLMLKSYLDTRKYNKVKDYIDEALHTDETAVIAPVCDHYTINSIVQYYMSIARANNITFITKIKFPQDYPILENDLTILLGNLLENAIEACMRKQTQPKTISIKAEITGKSMLNLSIKNSYDGEIVKKGELFMSSKRQSEGIGIASVRTIVKKYDGIMNIEYGSGFFLVSVLLNP